MSERFKVLFLTGCMFVMGLHLEGSIRLLLEGWFGPYRAELRVADEGPGCGAVAVSASPVVAEWRPGSAPAR
ncbi:MAG: hypothetical protein FJ294_05075 [Planctomycetes bacterium]|nr:hypothetical protein [Planctomycetota bacterium]